MEITLAIVISIVSVIITILNFALARKDKAIDRTKEEDKGTADQKLIDYRLTQVEKKLDKILDILDNFDKEIDERVNLALKRHIEVYHKREGE